MMKRRTFLSSATAAVLSSGAGCGAAPMAPLERCMRRFMQKYQIPGGSLAVGWGGKVVFARGFGWANEKAKLSVGANSLFRIASVSKPFTAMAIMRLVEQGKMSLEDQPFQHITLQPLPGAKRNPRLQKITVRQLLQHSAGWDKEKEGDPLFRSRQICAAAGVAGPADVETTIRYMLGQPLSFEPGTQFSYNNFGYMFLGYYLAQVTGRPLEEVIRREVLKPCGISAMRPGKTLTPAEGEVSYYESLEYGLAQSIFPQRAGRVPWPYGAFCLETNLANGGWLAHVTDLVKFTMCLDEKPSRPLLKPATMEAIKAAPAYLKHPEDVHFGLGWRVRPQGQAGKANLWHLGSLPGTMSIAARNGDGLNWAMLFNFRPKNWQAVMEVAQIELLKAVAEVPQW